jgi:hypothetical protein
MRAALVVHGPTVSVATLQAWCPTASRRAITTWLRDDRGRRRRQLRRVHWHQPGRVWAMDFSVAPYAIDGTYRYLLHVRDLATQYHVAALPVADTTGATVCGLLRALCVGTPAPLVLKVDNGSAFIGHELRAWARAVGTTLLYSPPRCPRYNGAIEASIASITTRAHHAAVLADRPGCWSCADVEAARRTANAIVRRPDRRTADDRWQSGTMIRAAERRRFTRAHATALRRKMTVPMRVQRRMAIVDTLQRLGYVSITRRADLVHSFNTKKRQEFRA